MTGKSFTTMDNDALDFEEPYFQRYSLMGFVLSSLRFLFTLGAIDCVMPLCAVSRTSSFFTGK